MSLTIRSEQVKDYPSIAEINMLAFSQPGQTGNLGSAEMALVDMLRHGPDFDPDLSLVAEMNGRVVGHALFYPYKVLLSGQEMPAASLHPLAVHPDCQKQGIGSRLMAEAHRRLAEKGVAFCFLYGEEAYYPRFGYRPNVFGTCHINIRREDIGPVTAVVEERQIEPADVAPVIAMWHTWFDGIPLAIFPGTTYLDWVSHIAPIQTSVMLIDGELRGFLRYHPQKPEAIRYFLAKDQHAAAQLLSYLNQKFAGQDIDSVSLPVHPESAAAPWLPCSATSTVKKLKAGMIKIFDEDNQTIRAYCENVTTGQQTAGLIVYPPYLDVAW